MNLKRRLLEVDIKKVTVRHWVELILFFFIISCILWNSLYIRGFECSKFDSNSGMIVETSGYEVAENVFTYTEAENSYIALSTIEQGTDQILFYFSNTHDQDVTAVQQYMDTEGKLNEVSVEAVWKAGTHILKFADIVSGDGGKYIIRVPSDFTVENIYYAKNNGVSFIASAGYLVIFLLLAFAVPCIILLRPEFAGIYLKFEKKILTAMIKIIDNRKKISSYFLCFIVIIFVTNRFFYLGSKMGWFIYSEKMIIVAVFTGLILGIFILFYHHLVKKIELVGFFLILFTGTIFSFAAPAFVGISWDDQIHYIRSAKVSHIFDQNLSIADVEVEGVFFEKEEQLRRYELLDELEHSNYFIKNYEQLSFNVAVAYTPSAIGMIIGRGLSLPFHMVVYLGRWMNVLLLAWLSYLSMKKLKTGKLVVLLIALIPTNIFLASNYTYDIWLTSWTMYGLSSFLGEWQNPDRQIDWGTAMPIAIAMYLGIMPKMVYFPLALIPVFMPVSKFQNKKEAWKYRIIILIAVIMPFLILYLQNIMNNGIGKGDTRGGSDVDATAQLNFIRQHPVKAFGIICNFLKGYLNPLEQGAGGDAYITFLAYLGFVPFDTKIFLFVIAAGACVSRENKEPKFPLWTKAGALMAYASIGFMAAFSMYVAFTPVAGETVAGCQGRYLIPALFPTIYILSRFSGKTIVKNIIHEENIIIICTSILYLGTISGLIVNVLNRYLI